MEFASSRDNRSDPFAGARTEPVFGDCEVAVIGATSPASMLVQTPPEQVQSENSDLAGFFRSSCRAGAIFRQLCGNRTVKLVGITEQPFLMAGSSRGLPIGSDLSLGESSKKREHCPVCGRNKQGAPE